MMFSSFHTAGPTVRSIQPSYKYGTPLIKIEPIAELEAVDIPHIKELCLSSGETFRWALLQP